VRPPSISGLVDVGLDILTTVVNATTGRIFAQTGNVNTEKTETDGVEWWQHVGFASRPAKPEPGKKAAQAITLKSSDRDVCISSVDNRGLELYGSLDHGETCLYAAGEDGTSQARVLLKKDGSINLYTRKGNAAAGAGMVVQVDAQNGVIRLINDKGYGIIIDQDGVKITAGASGLTLNSSGSAKLVATGQCQVDGGSICLGATATIATPVLVGLTGLTAIPSAKIFGSVA
jgi:hypothetical protein